MRRRSSPTLDTLQARVLARLRAATWPTPNAPAPPPVKLGIASATLDTARRPERRALHAAVDWLAQTAHFRRSARVEASLWRTLAFSAQAPPPRSAARARAPAPARS